MGKNRDFMGMIYGVILVVVLVILVCCVFASCTQSCSQGVERREEIGTVTDKGIKRSGDEDKYLVYTKNKDGESQVFEVTDNLIAMRFNSSDVYASIEIGKTYKFTVGGSRNEFLSFYPNIYSFEEVKME